MEQVLIFVRNLCNANASELLGEKLGRDLNDPDGYVSYFDVDYLATHTEKESNHYISSTSKDGYLDRSELRHWLRQLWKLRPDLHVRLWKVSLYVL